MLRPNLLAILAILLNAGLALSQNITISSGSVVSTCNSNEFEVILSSSTAISNASLTIEFSSDAIFQNINNYTVISNIPGEVEITGINLTGFNPTVLEYELYFPCSMISPQQDAFGSYVPFEIDTDAWYLKDAGGTILDSETNYSYLVQYPNIIASNFTNPTLTATSHSGQNVTRFIEYSNEGTISFNGVVRFTDLLSCGTPATISNIEISLVDGAGNLIQTVVSSSPVMVSPTEYYIDADFGTNPLIISSGVNPVSLRVTETLSINNCLLKCGTTPISSLFSTFDLRWGCQFGNFSPPSSFPTVTLSEAENLCKSIDDYQATITRDNVQPVVRAYRTNPQGIQPYENICIQSPDDLANIQPSMYTQREYKFINSGAAKAYEVNIVLSENNGVWPQNSDLVFLEEIELLNDLGVNITSSSQVSVILSNNLYGVNTSECVLEAIAAGKTPISYIHFNVDELPAGEELTLRYKVLRCCPRTENYFDKKVYFDTWNIGAIINTGNFGGGFYSNECTQLATVVLWGAENPGNGLFENDHFKSNYIELVQEDHTPPGDMVGGPNATCNYSGKRNVNIFTDVFNNSANDLGIEQLFSSAPSTTVNADLKVRITLDNGFLLNGNVGSFPNIDPSQVVLTSANPLAPFSSFPATNISYTSTAYGVVLSSGELGSEIECVFDLSVFSSYIDLRNFMENSYLTFPITPCCISAEPADYKIDWFVNLNPNVSGCLDCWIPLSRVENSINIHCPGCVTPGMIVTNAQVRRQNFGYLDLNQNGLVDVGVTAPLSSTAIDALIPINAYKTMPGDTVEFKSSAFFQDGDNSDEGFDYATYQSVHGVGVLDKLYLDITIPCGHENTNSWNIISQEIKHNNITYDISPYRVDPTGMILNDGQYFYIIPNTLFGSTYNYTTYDVYDVSIRYHICKNNIMAPESVPCDVSCRMWLAGGTPMGRNAFGVEASAVDVNGNLQPVPPATIVSALERATAVNPKSIFWCEAYASEITHYRFYDQIASYWSNRGDGSFWNQFVCKKKLISTYRVKLGDDPETDFDFFKFEHRPIPKKFASYDFPIPNYYNLDPTTYSILSRIPRHAGSNTYIPGFVDATTSPPTVVSPTSGNFAYNYADYILPSDTSASLQTAVNLIYPKNNLLLGDEYWSQTMTLYFNPDASCDSAGAEVPVATTSTQLPATYNIDPGICDLAVLQSTHITQGTLATVDDSLFWPKPGLVVTQPVIQSVQTNNHCFIFNIANLLGGLHQAENTYLIFNPPIGMSIASISVNGSTFTPVNGVFQLGTFATFGGSLQRNIQVCIQLDDCSVTQLTLPIRYGYGCNGYPADITEQGCWEDTLNVIINPEPVALNASSLNNTQDLTIDPCGDASFTICTDPTNNGDIYDLFWSITLPANAQLASDVTIQYSPSGQATQVVTIPQSAVVSGQTYFTNTLWKLTSLNDELCISFDYTFNPGCSPNIGAPPIVQLGGTAYCGDVIAVNPLINPLAVGQSSCTPISATAIVTDLNCNNPGAIDATVSGSQPFVFGWTGPNGFSASTEDVSGLSLAGTYTLTVTDNQDCAASFAFVVNSVGGSSNVYDSITACDSYTCAGGTYASSGVYTYTQYNSNTGCNEDVTLTLTIINSPSLLNPRPQTACGSFILPIIQGSSLSGNQAYYSNSQANGGVPILGPITSSQTVWIYDANGICSDEESFLVTIVAGPSITNPGNQTACGSYTLPSIVGTNLSGNQAYFSNSQANGGLQINGSISSTQVVWIYDGIGNCSDEESFLITIVESSEEKYDINACEKYVIPSGLGLGTIISTSGIYTFTSGSPNCLTEIWNVNIYNALNVTVSSLTNTLCNGSCTGSVTINANSGGTILYELLNSMSVVIASNNTGIFTNLCAGTYTVVATESGNENCSGTTTFNIKQPKAIALKAKYYPQCEMEAAGNISLDVTGGAPPYTFSWTGPNGFSSTNQSISNLFPGTYTVVVTDANGCQVIQSYTIELLQIGGFDLQLNQQGTCIYNIIALLPSNTPISGSNVNVLSADWWINGAYQGNNINFTYDFNQPGWYQVCLEVNLELDGVICWDKVCEEVYIDCEDDCSLLDNLSFTINDKEGGKYSFTTSSIPQIQGAGMKIMWDFGDGQQIMYNLNYGDPIPVPSHQYDQPGIYEVCLTVIVYLSDGTICENTVCQTIVVCYKYENSEQLCGTASYNYVQTPNTLTVNFSASGTPAPGFTVLSYEWYFGYANATGSGQFTSHVYPVPLGIEDTYVVILIITYINDEGKTCSVCTRKKIKVKKPSNLMTQYNNVNSLVVSPNPSNGQVKLVSNLDYDKSVQIIVKDAKGNIVVSEDKRYQNEISLDLKDVLDGVYFVELIGDSFHFIERMIIIH